MQDSKSPGYRGGEESDLRESILGEEAMKILRHASFLLAFWIIVTPAWAADDAAIEGLQSDANVTKNKADQNAQDINSLKNGLPAVEARVAALEAALDGAGGTIGKLQADLTAAITQISQLQADLNAEIAARQAADDGLSAAYMVADANLQAQIDVLGSVDIGALESRVGSVEETLSCVTYDVINRDLIFVGCNVHVRDGSGLTQSTSGLGNLIVGYNADAAGLLGRFGSHNLVLGDEQAYTGFGQLLTQHVGSSQDLIVVVGGNMSESVYSDRTTNIGKDLNLNVGFDFNTTVGRNLMENVSADRAMSIGGALTSTIDQDVAMAIGGGLTQLIARDMNVEAGMKMSLVGADEIALTSGAALINMTKVGNVSAQADGNVNVKATGTITLKGAKIIQN